MDSLVVSREAPTHPELPGIYTLGHCLTEDYVFASPSTAAMVMLGRTSNGRVEWKTAAGQTLKALQTAGAGEGEPEDGS